MFKNYGVMPGVISRESPFVLFGMLDSLDEDTELSTEEMDDYQKMFYGM